MGSPKITFVLNLVSKTPPDGEFENSEIVKEIKFSKYSYKINSLIKMFLIKKQNRDVKVKTWSYEYNSFKLIYEVSKFDTAWKVFMTAQAGP